MIKNLSMSIGKLSAAPNYGGMWLKNILLNRIISVFIIVLFSTGILPSNSFSYEPVIDNPVINIIYPKEDQLIRAVDSTFIFGNISSKYSMNEWRLTINNVPIEIHEDGGFLAFLPIKPDTFNFFITAERPESESEKRFREKIPGHYQSDDSLRRIITKTHTVIVPKPLRTFDYDSLRIGNDYRPPSGNLVLSTGDILEVSFQATPGCRAWFSIPGIIDSVAMKETDPRLQMYWEESVFGKGAVPDSMKIKGIYAGYYVLPPLVSVEDTSIIYYLTSPLKRKVIIDTLEVVDDALTYHLLQSLPDTVITSKSKYQIAFNSKDYPFTVKFTDTVQIVRHGPRKGYLAIFQPEGVEALVVGREGDWYKAQLSKNQIGWIFRESVEKIKYNLLPTHSYVTSLRTCSYDDSVVISVPLSSKHPFRIKEVDKRVLTIQLFGVISNTDWIRYDFDDKLIRLITWSQPEEDLYELKLEMTRDIWGYDAYYFGNIFRFVLNRPPVKVKDLKNKNIVIDPGHSKDSGAIGSTGLKEADANLAIALKLREVLKSKGANVIMTREDTSDVPLYDRPKIAQNNDADLFISIHNNAIPDGVNPFTNNGTSSYYYHPHSIELARAIHPELVEATGLTDNGMFHGNLAVLRPTRYPAVLLECAFMMIPEQEAMIKTDKFRSKVAKAITKGIENFLEGYDRDNRIK